MEPINNEINLNQENIQNIDFNSSCERCKNNKSTLFCEECKPFHYFCNQCDTSVHDLPSRINHRRTAIDSYQNSSGMQIQKTKDINSENLVKNLFFTPKNLQHNNSQSLNYNNNINNSKNNIKNNYQNDILNSNLNGTFSIKTPNQSVLNHSYTYTYIYNKNGNAVGIGADECKKVYSKDYVNELKIMHDKEKEQLIYKITTLENTINRIKSSLNEQIANIKFTQVTTEKEYNDKIEQIKKEYELKIDNLEKEKEYKDKEILNLNGQILEQKKINENISCSYEELKNDYNNLQNEHKLINKEYNILENKSKNENENINQKLVETIKSYEQFKEKTNIDMQKLINENEKKINDIIQQKDLEIKEIELNNKENSKKELDNLTSFLTEKYEAIIKDISNENNILKPDNIILVEKINVIEEKNKQDNEINNKNLNLIKNDVEEKNKKIKELQKNFDETNYKNKELENIISDLKNQNEESKQQINEKIKEINDLKDKILILNNEIKSTKATNEVINDKLKKLQEENKKIKVNFDAIDIEYNNKLKNFKFIEERNIMLENENENLKNKINRYIKPLSFNYTYVQK